MAASEPELSSAVPLEQRKSELSDERKKQAEAIVRGFRQGVQSEKSKDQNHRNRVFGQAGRKKSGKN